MTWIKLKWAIGVAIIVLLVGSTATMAVSNPESTLANAKSASPATTPADPSAGTSSPVESPFTNTPGNTIFVSFDNNYIAKITDNSASVFASGLHHEVGMVEDRSGNLYVANWYGDTILKYPVVNGALSSTPIVFASGLHRPMDLAFDRSGNLFEADYSAGTINKFIYSSEGLSNTPVPIITGLTDDNEPCGLCFDTQGNLYVAATIGGILKFAHTDSGLDPTQSVFACVSRARQMALDKNGNLFTADHVDQRVYEFINSPAGLSGEPKIFAAHNGLNGPMGVAFDSTGDLYVSNWGSGGGKDILEYPCLNGVLSNTPMIFASGDSAPNYLLAYTARGAP